MPAARQRGAPAVAVEQRHAELGLELADLLADARLGEVQAVGGAAEVKLLGDGDERAQLPQFHGRMIGAAFHRTRTLVLTVRGPPAVPSALATDLRGERTMTTTEPRLRGFMSPFEVPAPDGCEGWEAMYPYYALFSEERRESEEARGWFRDGMHFPEPMFPFDFVTADSPYMCLGQANSRIFAVPPALGIDHRVLYGWVYMSANSGHRPEEIGRRAELFGQRAGFYFQNWDELYGRWRTKVQETIDELASLEVPDLPEHRGRGGRHRGPRDRLDATRCSSPTTACSRASTASGSTTSSS